MDFQFPSTLSMVLTTFNEVNCQNSFVIYFIVSYEKIYFVKLKSKKSFYFLFEFELIKINHFSQKNVPC